MDGTMLGKIVDDKTIRFCFTIFCIVWLITIFLGFLVQYKEASTTKALHEISQN